MIALLASTSKAQSPYMGLIAYSYSETINEHGDLKKIHKPLLIIYSRDYCQLTIGDISIFFKVASYSRELIKGDLYESFINDETNAVPWGWYSIDILHNKPGKSQITIQMPLRPGGAAYFAEDAQVYSEDGKVSGYAHVTNWKELEMLDADTTTNVNYEKNPQLKKLAFKTNIDLNKYVSLNTNWNIAEKQEGYLGEIRFQCRINKEGKISSLNHVSDMLVMVAGKDVIGRVQNVLLSMPNWVLKNNVKRPLQPQTFDLTIILNSNPVPVTKTK